MAIASLFFYSFENHFDLVLFMSTSLFFTAMKKNFCLLMAFMVLGLRLAVRRQWSIFGRIT